MIVVVYVEVGRTQIAVPVAVEGPYSSEPVSDLSLERIVHAIELEAQRLREIDVEDAVAEQDGAL